MVAEEQTTVKAAPVAQILNCQKLSSVDQEKSALHKNIAEKGAHAYYHAHTRKYEIPPDAKIISGPGLVTGGPPQRISGPDGNVVDAPSSVEQSAVLPTNPDETTASSPKEIAQDAIPLKEYSWSDEGDKVKIYVECSGLPAEATESLVNTTFESKSLRLDVETAPCRRFKIAKLSREIIPEDCKVRLNAAKGRITMTLKKKRGGLWTNLAENH
eukprot:TRINITY_DN4504_c1_g1_i1.p1 TRINITY_DN4504_c1_g1~~TRINITY_DN4504_c1_g1_i1.p1  ORF type:complete len:214 (+),score=46.76 TRINITY_DN4504_c1_g1_i1:77-718(+)